ncbi:MAG: hypothetical protein ACYDEA_12660 [Candidatus Dormibacteria bacterium]
MDEEESVPEAEAGPEEASPPAWSPWCDLPPPSRPFAERALMNWVEFVFRSGWPEPSEAVKPCWPYHADAVATLRGLNARLDQAYFPPVKDREIGAAPIDRMTDWDTDLERAVPRWKDSFRPCPDPDGECSRSKPPSYRELAGPQNAAETDQAAEGAWGAVPPDLPPPIEPWEAARGIADAQATATEEQPRDAAAAMDISGGVESW